MSLFGSVGYRTVDPSPYYWGKSPKNWPFFSLSPPHPSYLELNHKKTSLNWTTLPHNIISFQSDIDAFEKIFINGEDPFADLKDDTHLNSVASILKRFFHRWQYSIFNGSTFPLISCNLIKFLFQTAGANFPQGALWPSDDDSQWVQIRRTKFPFDTGREN